MSSLTHGYPSHHITSHHMHSIKSESIAFLLYFWWRERRQYNAVFSSHFSGLWLGENLNLTSKWHRTEMGCTSFMAPLGVATNNKLTKLETTGRSQVLSLQSFDHFWWSFFYAIRAQTMETDFFFHYNNKLERVSQSTTMRINRREVSADFKNSRHRKTTTIPTKTKMKITILNTFYCVTECLPLTSSE